MENRSPNKAGGSINVYNSIPVTSSTPHLDPKGLGKGGIIGIALCGVSLLVLVIGIIITCRYRKIAKEREKLQAKQKQSQVKAYLDAIPDVNGHAEILKSPVKKSASSTRGDNSSAAVVRTNHGARAHNYELAHRGAEAAEEHV